MITMLIGLGVLLHPPFGVLMDPEAQPRKARRMIEAAMRPAISTFVENVVAEVVVLVEVVVPVTSPAASLWTTVSWL